MVRRIYKGEEMSLDNPFENYELRDESDPVHIVFHNTFTVLVFSAFIFMFSMNYYDSDLMAALALFGPALSVFVGSLLYVLFRSKK